MCLSRRLSSAVNLIVECMHWIERVCVTFECGVMRLWCCSLAAGFELGSSNWKSERQSYRNDSHSVMSLFQFAKPEWGVMRRAAISVSREAGVIRRDVGISFVGVMRLCVAGFNKY